MTSAIRLSSKGITPALRVQELAAAARMLAIVGAWIKLQSAERTDPTIRALLNQGLELALGRASTALDRDQAAPLLTEIEMALVESRDLFKDAGQLTGWMVEEPAALEAIGRASSAAFDRIVALAHTRPLLHRALLGRFLDVGTGVGAIALRAAKTCPDLAVEAIDIWTPALRLAAQRIAASAHASRITLFECDVATLSTEPRFTLAWLPTMFMRRDVVHRGVARIAAASHRGGWLVAALYTIPEDPFAAVMARLRTLRSGGEITAPGELADLLRSHGYVDVEVDRSPIATFVLGRLP